METRLRSYEIVNFNTLEGVPCPCGVARRAFSDSMDFPATVHITDISVNARLHYHSRITEMYYFLECEPGAQMQLDEEFVPVQPGTAILIRPGTRHRAVGKMKVLIVAIPKFDPSDEWED